MPGCSRTTSTSLLSSLGAQLVLRQIVEMVTPGMVCQHYAPRVLESTQIGLAVPIFRPEKLLAKVCMQLKPRLNQSLHWLCTFFEDLIEIIS
jgi:hypothetical protein